MSIQIEPPQEDHGIMPWTGHFDAEGRAIFECPECGASIALGGPSERTYKRIAMGDFYARHQAYTTPEIVKAALDLEIWRQAPGQGEFIKKWEASGGRPLLMFSKIEVKRAAEE